MSRTLSYVDNKALQQLEELLSITEPAVDQLQPDQRGRWKKIAVAAADLRALDEQIPRLAQLTREKGCTAEHLAGWVGLHGDRYGGPNDVERVLEIALREGDDPEWVEEMILAHADPDLRS